MLMMPGAQGAALAANSWSSVTDGSVALFRHARAPGGGVVVKSTGYPFSPTTGGIHAFEEANARLSALSSSSAYRVTGGMHAAIAPSIFAVDMPAAGVELNG